MQLKVTAETKQAEAAMKKLRTEGEKPYVMKAEPAPTSMSKTARSVGAGGGTGSAASDFAEQSRGLGGLVRVYATFAANIFAASAAFSALSRAMDTTNMVRGLDQLGAASGRALGSLSKQLVAVTDGAINLREAMTATAQASAGGMSDSAILRMGAAADKAAKALGVAMPDALSRISRGITKLEPELLDEIGIMVRVDKTSQAYAESIGKTANALTDFEKRQAFANAVLDQAEKKFGAIKIESNPYAQLLASMENVAQKGLELVNVVLAPIAKILASSPSALAVAMAGVIGVLAKMAIPIFSDYKRQLQEAAELSKEKAARVAENYAGYQVQMTNAQRDQIAARLKNETAALTASAAQLKKTATDSAKLKSGVIFGYTQNLPQTAEEQAKAYKVIDSQITRNENSAKKLAATDIEGSKAAMAKAEGLKALKAQLIQTIALTNALAEATERANLENEKPNRFGSGGDQRQRILDRANLASKKANILSQVSIDTESLGAGAAYSNLRERLKDDNIKGISAVGTKIKGAFAIATSAVSTFLGAFGPWFAIAGVALAAITSFFSWISKSKEAAEKFETSMDGLSASIKTASDTMDLLANKSISEQLSVSSLQARANAILGLSDSLTGLYKSYEKLKSLENVFEKSWNFVAGIFTATDAEKLSKNIAGAVKNAINLSKDVNNQGALQKVLTEALGSGASVSNLEKRLNNLSDPEKEIAIRKIESGIKALSNTINNAASITSAFETGLKEISVAITGNITSLLPTDSATKFGIQLGNIYTNLNKMTGKTTEGLAEMQKVLADNSAIGALSEGLRASVIEATKYSFAVEQASKKLQDAKDAYQKVKTSPDGSSRTTREEDIAKQNIVAAQKNVDSLLKGQDVSFKTFIAEVRKQQIDFLQQGYQIVLSNAATALQKARLSIRESYGDNVASAERALIRQETGQKLKEIDLQFKQFQGQKDNTEALQELNDTLKLSTKTSKQKETDEFSPGVTFASIRQGIADRAKQKKENAGANDIALEFAKASAISKVLGEQEVQLANNSAKIAKEKFKDSQKEYDLKLSGLEINKKDLDISNQYSDIYDRNAALASLEVEAKIAENRFLKENAAIVETLRNTKDKDRRNELLAQAKILGQKFEQSNLERDMQFAANDSLKTTEKNLKISRDLLDLKQAQNSIMNSQDAFSKSQLAYAKELGIISEAEFLTKTASIEQARIARDLEVSKAQIQNESVEKLKSAEANKAAKAEKGPLSESDLQAYNDEVARVRELNNTKILSATTEASLNQIINAQTLARNILLANQNEKLKEAQELTQSLSDVFGELGGNVGKLGEAILKMANDDESYLKNKIDLEAKIVDAQMLGNGEDEAKRKKELAALDKKRAKDEVSNVASVANAAKKMFDERTNSYKVLNGIEKAAHTYKMAMMLKENLTRLGGIAKELVASVTANGTIALSAVPGALLKFVQQLGWPGVAAGAAFVASLGLGGGSSARIPSVEDVSKVSGTGQSYDANGNLVLNGGGVFGDPTAKNAAILDSLEMLAKINYDMLDFGQNETYKALLGIKSNTEKFVSYLATGKTLRPGGTEDLTGTGTANFGSNIPLLGGLIGSIFGGGTSIEQVSNKLNIGGTIGQIQAGQGTYGAYQLNKVTTSGGWFGGGGTRIDGAGQNVDDPKLKKLLGAVAKSGVDSIVTILAATSGKIGAALTDYKDNLIKELATEDFSVSVEMKGRTPAQITEDLLNDLGTKIDDILTRRSPELLQLAEKYADTTESMLDFATRVIYTADQVKLAFTSITKSLEGIDDEKALILSKTAGGLDELLSLVDNFGDNFLTEAEKLVPIQAAVTKQMSDLGYASTDTMKEFKDLVLGFKVTDGASAEVYTALLKVAPAFAKVHKEAESLVKVLSATELAAAKVEQSIKIMELLGDTEGVLAAQRKKEYDALDERLKPTQLYIYALQDEQKARTKLTTSINSTITSLKQSIKTLGDYKTALMGGANSILDPTQKYNQSKTEFERLKGIINGPATTAAQQQAQADAISKFPAASDAFLNASKVLFSSSEQYTKDFQSVSNFIDSASALLATQQTDAEKQLTVLENSYAALGGIADSTKTTATLMSEYITLWNTAMQGGSSSSVMSTANLTLAAAPITTTTSGVTTVAPTTTVAANDSNADLIKEVQKLRDEIAALRADQKEQTGHLITTNYDANNKAATTISDAIVSAEESANWSARSSVALR